jgi:3-methylcrotonyl-CoA carboxylase alpha subunit
MLESVLIANRGEIAMRVAAACQEMGIRTIAVYSDADRGAAHVRACDEAYRVGPAPARESYLNIEAILAVACAHGAEAIHPGYGFLSENADFAEACERAGIIFIGPPAAAIRLMGSKTAAKRAVAAAGVPTVPGYADDARDVRTLQREAARIGYPIMLKAAAGGGGKGMRVVRTPSELAEAAGAARREALAAFGDDCIFLEKLIVAPRHVEFQILADRYGNTIHLGERECSIQRRHQKVVEESPCIALTPELRARMGEAAVRAARAAGYVNAGTCEFLLDADGAFYFLEMNTRLQVEHPVTEYVTGLDLVRRQLLLAAGEPLGMSQEQIQPRGHAIEVRVYAEDPANSYLPSTGPVLAFYPPHAPGVRVDAGVAAGDEVTVDYDPMLAKLIATAEDRASAIQRLQRALDHFTVLGIATNIPLLRAIAAEPDFQAGRTTTAYLEQHDVLGTAARRATTPRAVLVAGALFETLSAGQVTRTSGPFNPWKAGATTVSGGERRFHYDTDGESHIITVRAGTHAGEFAVTVDDAPYPGEGRVSITADLRGNHLSLDQGGPRQTMVAARRGSDVLVAWRGRAYALAKPRPLDVDTAARGGETTMGAQALLAPMAGTIIKINVRAGETVAAQQTLLVLGAMKMEHAIVAPYAGIVTRVAYAQGDVVPGGAVLIELESGPAAERLEGAKSGEADSGNAPSLAHRSARRPIPSQRAES